MLNSTLEKIHRRIDDIDYQLDKAFEYNTNLKFDINRFIVALAKQDTDNSHDTDDAILELGKIKDLIEDNEYLLGNAQTRWHFVKQNYFIKKLFLGLFRISRKVIFLETLSGMIHRSEANARKIQKITTAFFFGSAVLGEFLQTVEYFLETTSEIHQFILEIDNLQPDENIRAIINSNKSYVDEKRIKELRAIKSRDFDLTKLLQICDEINRNFSDENYLSVAMLTRAMLDHIPPIMQCKNFSEVVNNYAGTKSFRESMQHLDKSSRKIADAYLHSHVRAKEVLPNKTQVDFSNEIDVLLSEIVRLLK